MSFVHGHIRDLYTVVADMTLYLGIEMKMTWTWFSV